jgi:mannose-6-phosphate isomerase-like protein (cupin superfamily)
MGGYNVVNLKEVEDKAPTIGQAPNLEARFATEALALDQAGVSYQRLAPNFRAPFGHRHEAQEEVYVVVEGSGRLKLDDEVVELGPWDAVRIAPKTVRCLEGGPEGIAVLAFGPRLGKPANDAELVPDWWTD